MTVMRLCSTSRGIDTEKGFIVFFAMCLAATHGQPTTSTSCGDPEGDNTANSRLEAVIQTQQQQIRQQQQQIDGVISMLEAVTGNYIAACQKETLPRDCGDLKRDGNNANGVYTVYIDTCLHPVHVYCDMVTDGGGWLVLQRRQDGSVKFYRPWADYATGFGNLAGEFWLGNENIHLLSSIGRTYHLRIDLADFNGSTSYAEYSNFSVASANEKYTLSSTGTYSGTAGDSLTYHVGNKFSTYDEDNDRHSSINCAFDFKGAWWYHACHSSNLNGLYLNGSHTSYADGVDWYAWRGHHYSLKFTEMKIKPQ